MAVKDIKTINEIMFEFLGVVNSIKLYSNSHPQVLSRINSLYEKLTGFFEEAPALTFFILDDEIIVFDEPLPIPDLMEESFVKILKENNVEHVTLLQGLTKAEIFNFLTEMAANNNESITASNHIKLGKVVINGALEEDKLLPHKSAELLSFKYKAAAELKRIYLEVKDSKVPDTVKAKKIVEEFIKIYDKSIILLDILSPIKSDDEYTYLHITNVALLTICFADYLGFSGKTLEEIGIAALLHDVGKMFVPEGILKKPGPLTAQERAVMETHTLKGAQYIGQQENIPKLTMIAALEHHIKYDGSGYPIISKKWETNIASQIVSIADVYDALRSKRPYQEAMKYEEVIAILQAGRGSDFNPVLIENFLTMIEA